MKQELRKIAQDLEQGTITQNEARTFLLGLLGIRRNFSDWLKEVAEIDVKQKFMLDYTEIIEWQEWYQKGLTPIESVQLNYYNYG